MTMHITTSETSATLYNTVTTGFTNAQDMRDAGFPVLVAVTEYVGAEARADLEPTHQGFAYLSIEAAEELLLNLSRAIGQARANATR